MRTYAPAPADAVLGLLLVASVDVGQAIRISWSGRTRSRIAPMMSWYDLTKLRRVRALAP